MADPLLQISKLDAYYDDFQALYPLDMSLEKEKS
jgi:ABC-type branched-subunit amino acid transport system ATPase component